MNNFKPIARLKLPRPFYQRPTLEVAPDLVGKILVRKNRGVLTVGRIVEVEAYRNSDDPASHAYRGVTPRNRLMFGEGGVLYVYFIYGMYFCANVVTDKNGVAGAVLIRAVEPVEGIEGMRRRRKTRSDDNLTNGPGKVCTALAIDRRLNGADLQGESIYLADDGERMRVGISERIGIRSGKEKRWRFFAAGNKFVSRIRFNR